jgi:hypothetical protein
MTNALTISEQLEMRGQIVALETAMRAMPEHQIEIKTTHYFAGGVYAREIFIPKGTTLTGKIHKFEHLNVVSQGDLSVWTDEGMKRVRAPAVIISKPGIKRAGFAHEDTVWTTFHATDETDPDVIEKKVVTETYEEFLAFIASEEQKCLSSP